MLAMKTDMSGAAIVLAVLTACQELAVPFPVTGLLPLAENAISDAARVIVETRWRPFMLPPWS